MRRAPLVLSDERTVVVGVDGASPWRPAVAWAAAEAVLRDAVLRVVHVTGGGPADATGAGEGDRGPAVPPDRWPARTGPGPLPPVEESVDWLGATHPALAVRGEVLEGVPSNALVEAAGAAELLVVGAHRPVPLGRWFVPGGHRGQGVHRLGSVARSCVAHAPCPVEASCPVAVVRGLPMPGASTGAPAGA